MDQRNGGIGSGFGSQDLGGGGIDDPGMAQPSIGRADEPEARGLSTGSLDTRGEFPAEGREDLPGTEGADTEDLGSGTDNIAEGNVGGVMGGPRQSQGQGQGG